MPVRPLLTIAAILDTALGLGALLAPALTAKLLGLSLDAGGLVTARLFGAMLIGAGATFWFARAPDSSEHLRAVIAGGFVSTGLSVVIVLTALISGIMGRMGWPSVLALAALSVGFGYFGLGASEKKNP